MTCSPHGELAVAGAPEFSRPVEVDRLPPEGRTLTLEATEPECQALAARFGVDAVDSLRATVFVRPLGGKRRDSKVEVKATMMACVHQTCVVTLEPLTRTLTETTCQRFGDCAAGPVGGEASEVDVDPEAVVDPPEPIVMGVIDAGALVAELLGLAIDPHPRAEGAVFESWSIEPSLDMTKSEPVSGPFAALSGLARTGGSQKNGA